MPEGRIDGSSGAAIIGLFVATLLPVAVNTYEGLRAVPAHLIEAAEAMGMTPRETLWIVEIPNAMNVIFAGIRTALAIAVYLACGLVQTVSVSRGLRLAGRE
ncbi:ABC transporter permease subunit [Pseudomonas sp. G(2018)]|uniref:ABC transporter permease subunit n=1 Tax=Pseudomonas sp. G(2018) TaxID=2502242 RepID=UPI002114AEC4|nr:ABC transporter permease subunit [Pseudomonas sp. G(2018)]